MISVGGVQHIQYTLALSSKVQPLDLSYKSKNNNKSKTEMLAALDTNGS